MSTPATPTGKQLSAVAASSSFPDTSVQEFLPQAPAGAPQETSVSADQPDQPPASFEVGQYASAASAFLRSLRLRAKLLPLLDEFGAEQQLLQRAEDLGLAVAPEDLQAAADRFRVRSGIASAPDTDAWLGHYSLTTTDFEDALKRDILINKLRDHMTTGLIARHWDDYRPLFDRARLKHLVVVSDDLPASLVDKVTTALSVVAQAASPQGASSAPPERDTDVVYRYQLPTKAADIVFAAAPGSVVGPLSIPPGHHFVLVEAIEPASLNEDTVTAIRDRLFSTWIAENAASQPSAALLRGSA